MSQANPDLFVGYSKNERERQQSGRFSNLGLKHK